jgi:2-dehydro-3-deoxygalactonokinase
MTAFCAAADWGTTSFRLWLLADDGTVLGESRGDDGILSTKAGEYPDRLNEHLAVVGAASDVPVIICGMAGARQGWMEAPYVDTPADLPSLCSGALAVGVAGRDVRILPGVAQRDVGRPDVMRGEETQLLGLNLPDTLVCMPGTHSKWVSMSGGKLTGFATHMTGELFAVLSDHSILRHSTLRKDFAAGDPAFQEGVSLALADGHSLSRMLFSVRARGLVSEDDGCGAAFLSGLLIGSEIASARSENVDGRKVVLLASGRLASLYEKALALADIATQREDAEAATRQGLLRAARQIWGQT